MSDKTLEEAPVERWGVWFMGSAHQPPHWASTTARESGRVESWATRADAQFALDTIWRGSYPPGAFEVRLYSPAVVRGEIDPAMPKEYTLADAVHAMRSAIDWVLSLDEEACATSDQQGRVGDKRGFLPWRNRDSLKHAVAMFVARSPKARPPETDEHGRLTEAEIARSLPGYVDESDSKETEDLRAACEAAPRSITSLSMRPAGV